LRVIDVDTHISEPPDLWTSRVSKKWGDQVLHVKWDERLNGLAWFIGDERIAAAPSVAMAGWKLPPPSNPPTYEDAHPGAYDAVERLKLMDEEGIYAHLLYPNVGGFGSGRFLKLKDPALMLESVRAYNDFAVDWSVPGKGRLVPLCVLPFWDVEESVKELRRAANLGHKGVIFTSQPHVFDQPMLADPHWNPVFATAQDLQLPVNFHIGSADLLRVERVQRQRPAGELCQGQRRPLPGQRPCRDGDHFWWPVLPLPGPQVCLGGERHRLGPVPAGSDGLAVPRQRRSFRAAGPGSAAPASISAGRSTPASGSKTRRRGGCWT